MDTCWMGTIIETEDGRVCKEKATHLMVGTKSGMVVELCQECALWCKMIREHNFKDNPEIDEVYFGPMSEFPEYKGG